MVSNYVKYINETLRPDRVPRFRLLDLFAGCGGLSLGFEAAGFETVGYEMEESAAKTYSENLAGTCFPEKLTSGYAYPKGEFDVVIAGPPCQPFSVGGHQLGTEDARNGFPIFIDAIERLQPKIWLFENVRGMLYSNKPYFELVLSRLKSLGYVVEYKLVNAVSFGVPQNRERVFVVGHRHDFIYPTPSKSKVTVGEAIGDLINSIQDDSKILTRSMDEYVLKYEIASKCINPRDLYTDRPARTITCRNICGSTGDMMRVKLLDGRRRRISVREAARLQSFPDWFEFVGNESQQYNQIGNAVPPLLGYQFALAIADALKKEESTELLGAQVYILHHV
jgi:DNA (cytosine-5)-methyltransferase 1